MKLVRIAAPSILVAAGVLGAIAMSGGARSAVATANPGDANIHVVNVSDQGFGVSWTTTGAYTGSSVLYGASCASATSPVAETPSNGAVHLANVGGLQPATTYYYKIVANGVTNNNGGKCFTATTFASQPMPPVPATLFGQAMRGNCKTAASGALVVLTDGTSGGLAAIAGGNGRWALPFGDLTDAKGAYLNPGAGSVFTVTETTDANHTHSVSTDGATGDLPKYDGTSQVVGPVQVCTVATAGSVTADASSLSGTYDGKSHPVTATTSPSGLSYSVTYGGSTTAPTNAGTYPFTISITDPDYYGSATGTLVIGLAKPSITDGGKSVLTHGRKAALSATMRSTVTGDAVAGRTLSFTLGKQSCIATTDANGTASCSLNRVAARRGMRALGVSFAGDKPGSSYDYSAASLSKMVRIK